METPSTGNHAPPMTGISDWLSWYVGGHGMDMVHKDYSELRASEPTPLQQLAALDDGCAADGTG